MREDMFEVIIERPRRGGAWKRHKPLPRPDDESPTWQPVSRGRGTKSLNENLAPLRRFLRRSVGRPWDQVFSEICATLDVKSAVKKHVRDHLGDLVELHVIERDGELWSTRGWRPEKLAPGFRDRMYVCPKTGILRVIPPRPRRTRRIRQSPVYRVGPRDVAFVFQDQWWLVTLAPVSGTCVYDVMLEMEITVVRYSYGLSRAWHLYGQENVYAVANRALTRREAKKLGLRR